MLDYDTRMAIMRGLRHWLEADVEEGGVNSALIVGYPPRLAENGDAVAVFRKLCAAAGIVPRVDATPLRAYHPRLVEYRMWLGDEQAVIGIYRQQGE